MFWSHWDESDPSALTVAPNPGFKRRHSVRAAVGKIAKKSAGRVQEMYKKSLNLTDILQVRLFSMPRLYPQRDSNPCIRTENPAS